MLDIIFLKKSIITPDCH